MYTAFCKRLWLLLHLLSCLSQGCMDGLGLASAEFTFLSIKGPCGHSCQTGESVSKPASAVIKQTLFGGAVYGGAVYGGGRSWPKSVVG